MRCEVCGACMRVIYKNMSKRENKQFFFCPSCKLRWAPYLDVDRTFSSKLDEKSRKEALAEIREKEFEQVNNLIGKYVSKGSRGLEVGCAYGWYLDSVRNRFEMEGIEPEESIAERAREKGHKVYTGFFPQDLSYETPKYDFMVFNNVWEHINHVSEMIDGSLRYMKAGGLIFVTIPLSTGGIYKIAELFEKIGRTKELVRLWQLHFHSPHIYYYNKENFQRIMQAHSYRLIACENIRGGINPSRMKERFEMDADERHGKLKANLFRIAFPIIRLLPSDKAIFVFKYDNNDGKTDEESCC